MFYGLYYIKMAVKAVAKKVVKEVAKKVTKKVVHRPLVVDLIEKVKQLEVLEPTKSEQLEYHLSKFVGNTLDKQEIRAIFASLFR